METTIKILTMIIVVATALRTLLQAIVTIGSMPIQEILIKIGEFLSYFDWF